MANFNTEAKLRFALLEIQQKKSIASYQRGKKRATKTKQNGKNFEETTYKKLQNFAGMMFYLRQTRPETYSTAFNEKSKTIFEQKNVVMKNFEP